jgi:taurine dioxygenase
MRPRIAASLWAREVSPEAMPTLFANAVGVLDRLPADLRARVDWWHAVRLKDTHVLRTNQRWREEDIDDEAVDRFARFEHPIVYRLPHMDRKTILVSEFFTSHVAELPRNEGEAVLQELFRRLYSDEKCLHPQVADQ